MKLEYKISGGCLIALALLIFSLKFIRPLQIVDLVIVFAATALVLSMGIFLIFPDDSLRTRVETKAAFLNLGKWGLAICIGVIAMAALEIRGVEITCVLAISACVLTGATMARIVQYTRELRPPMDLPRG